MAGTLTSWGLWVSLQALGEENGGAAAKVAADLGFGAIWLGGSPMLPSVRPLLEATESLTVGTSIVNVWSYPEPAQLAEEFHALDADFPGRLILGIGVGHPEATQEYQKPLAKLRSFLDGLDAAPKPVPQDRLIVASLGPRSLEMAAERTLGTIPYFVPPAHTRAARAAVGPDRIVAPELAVVVDEQIGRARESARGYAEMYLGLQNYTQNLLRHGFTERDIADGGSDALIDTVVPQGSARFLAARAQEHIDAGADHVAIQTVGVTGVPEQEWVALASALGLERRD
jgi:probable F420-dependent oxidoreductase